QGDPPGRVDRGAAEAVVRRQGIAAGAGLCREHAPGRPRRAEDQGVAPGGSGGPLRESGGVRRRSRPGGGRTAEYPGGTGAGEGSVMSDLVTTDALGRLKREVARHPYPLVFATISGAHLYGFPSPDSDFDLRGCHLLPLRQVVGLDAGRETIETSAEEGGFELDLVTHDARKSFGLLLKKNGYVLEQLYSPLVVHTTPEHEELKSIARDCVTRHHAHYYLGFAESQWRLLQKERPRRVKPLLYVYRVLLTGIHLMRTGEVEANLVRLNEEARLL